MQAALTEVSAQAAASASRRIFIRRALRTRRLLDMYMMFSFNL
jgi:hypothetical protein